MTTLLSSLKVIDRPKIEPKPPILGKRMKLIEKLDEQLAMVQCLLQNQAFEAFKDKSIKDPETGERKIVRKRKAVRPWYYDSDNHYYFEIKVGLKTMELAKGKTAIDVGPKDKLLEVIGIIIQAVERGELDQQILQVSPPKAPKVRRSSKTVAAKV